MDTNDVRRRFGLIREGMLSTFVERADTVEVALTAAVAQEHLCLLGPPGTGKSAVITALVACFSGARIFDTLLTKFSTEDEVCGPAKLSALKQDRFERNTDGYLPGVEVGFVDETFKANAAVLNSLLSVLNERKYKGRTCPLRFCAGASNEMPEDETLGALWDRFLLRHVVEYVQSDSAWQGMLLASPTFVPPCTIDLAEWDAACAEARSLPISPEIVAELSRVKAKLATDGIIISDRRWIKLLGALRAAAWLDGEPCVTKDQLYVLRFGLWQKPDDRDRVTAILKTVDMGPARECQDIIDAALRAFEGRPSDPAAYYQAIPVLAGTLTDAAKRVQSYSGKLSKRAAEKVARQMVALKTAHTTLTADLAKRYSL